MTSESESVSQYSVIASIYDRLMVHVRYEEWFYLIQNIIRKFYNKKYSPKIFEIGAGTGVLGQQLKKHGFSYTGSDLSFQMCFAAGKKNLLFPCIDGRNMAVKEKRFDLVLFLYDGINYLQSPDDYLSLFTETDRILLPGGLFLFDITTQMNSANNFSDFLDFEDYGDFSYIRHSYYHRESEVQYNDFTIFKQFLDSPALYRKFMEHHVQKVLPVKTVEKLVPLNLFKIEGIWDGYSFDRYSDCSERVHFLLRKCGVP